MKRRTVLLKLWIPFVLLLIPVLLLNATTYQLSEELIERNMRDVLQEAQTDANIFMSKVQDSITATDRLLLDSRIQRLKQVNKIRGQRDMEWILEASRCLRSDFPSSKDFKISVYFNKGNILIHDRVIFSGPNALFRDLYNFEDFSLSQLIDFTMNLDYGLTFIPESRPSKRNGRSIFYARPLSVTNDRYHGGVIFVEFGTTEAEVFPFTQSNASQIFLIDNIAHKDNNILFEKTSSELSDENKLSDESLSLIIQNIDAPKGQTKKDDHLITYVNIKDNLYLVSIHSRSEVLSSLKKVLTSTWIINISSAIFIVILVRSYFSKYNREVIQTVNLLEGQGDPYEKDVFSFIRNSITNMTNKLETVNKKEFEYLILLEKLFWDRALNNTDVQSLPKLAEKIGIESASNFYCLVIIKITDKNGNLDQNSIERINNYRDLFITDVVDKYQYSLCTLGLGQLIILIPISNLQAVKTEVESLVDLFPEDPLLSVTILSSTPFDDLSSIYNHYYNCRNLLNTFLPTSDSLIVHWCNTIPDIKRKDTYLFSQDTELQLLSAVECGNIEMTKKILNEIFKQNYLLQTPTPEIHQLIISKFKLFIYKTYDAHMEKSLNDYLNVLNVPVGNNEILQIVTNILKDFASYYQNINENQDEILKKSITNYMNANLDDDELSLTTIADKFAYSESHFSKLFKELMGESFSTYLEDMRLNKADDLLRNTNILIKDITKACGYKSANSFRRAYKRKFSITPSERRNKIKNQNGGQE